MRSGVRIYDVISKSPVWQVTSEISQRGDVASCVARLGDRVEHSTSGRLVLISDWSDIGQLTLILTCHWSVSGKWSQTTTRCVSVQYEHVK